MLKVTSPVSGTASLGSLSALPEPVSRCVVLLCSRGISCGGPPSDRLAYSVAKVCFLVRGDVTDFPSITELER